MGYYSNYELLVDQEKNEWFENEIFRFCNERGEFAHFDESTKWYTFKEDMVELSKIYKDNLFKISRFGEEPRDIEDVYFKDGKLQICKAKIELDAFDESKLIKLEAND
jgi:hypothetical protein